MARSGVRWDAKTQAAVHAWYERVFGYPVPPVSSAAEGVATWPETATATAEETASVGRAPAHSEGAAGAAAGRYPGAVADDALSRFKRWFWRPPRPHGEALRDRTVGFLELFYDLVYVAVVGQAAHHLAGHVSAGGLAEFAVVFALLWMAWVTGSLYLELHGREDGRTRSLVFLQMGVLALLAVYTADAAGAGGRGFALVYAAFLALQAWLWSAVRREDRRDHPEFLGLTGRYVTGLGLSAAVLLASAFLPPGPRLLLWAAFAGVALAGWLLLRRSRGGLAEGLPPTPSLVERFGLFTIVVLGEVIFGIVGGLSGAPDGLTIATGLLALAVGSGLWWLSFDLVGRRLPREDGWGLTSWVLGHLPLALAVAAAGAAMVSLLEHARDPRTPAGTAWLLAGAVAAFLLALIPTERALADAERLASVYRPLRPALAGGAAAALGAGALRPAPWLLALLLVAVLSALWGFAVSRFLRVDAWGEAERSTTTDR